MTKLEHDLIASYKSGYASFLTYRSFYELVTNCFVIFEDKTFYKGDNMPCPVELVFKKNKEELLKIKTPEERPYIYVADGCYTFFPNTAKYLVVNECVFFSSLKTKPLDKKAMYDEIFKLSKERAEMLMNTITFYEPKLTEMKHA